MLRFPILDQHERRKTPDFQTFAEKGRFLGVDFHATNVDVAMRQVDQASVHQLADAVRRPEKVGDQFVGFLCSLEEVLLAVQFLEFAVSLFLHFFAEEMLLLELSPAPGSQFLEVFVVHVPVRRAAGLGRRRSFQGCVEPCLLLFQGSKHLLLDTPLDESRGRRRHGEERKVGEIERKVGESGGKRHGKWAERKKGSGEREKEMTEEKRKQRRKRGNRREKEKPEERKRTNGERKRDRQRRSKGRRETLTGEKTRKSRRSQEVRTLSEEGSKHGLERPREGTGIGEPTKTEKTTERSSQRDEDGEEM